MLIPCGIKTSSNFNFFLPPPVDEQRVVLRRVGAKVELENDISRWRCGWARSAGFYVVWRNENWKSFSSSLGFVITILSVARFRADVFLINVWSWLTILRLSIESFPFVEPKCEMALLWTPPPRLMATPACCSLWGLHMLLCYGRKQKYGLELLDLS